MKSRLEQNWTKFFKQNSLKQLPERINGSSPPSVFVGRNGYPKVWAGPMIPPLLGDTTILDKSELWAGKSLEEIVSYRLSLVRAVSSVNVFDISSRYLESVQELVMSERPVESEAIFEKKPFAGIEPDNDVRLNSGAAPFGPAAPIKSFKASSISGDQNIESAYYDTDLRVADAVMDLYRRRVEASRIQRVLSMGMLGLKKNRKLVPTRWSVTATDNIISSQIIDENGTNTSIDMFEVMKYSYLANYYSVILVPDEIWRFEMIESWCSSSGLTATSSDYEDARGLDHYPSIAGAYFAARLAVAEHLSRRQRKGAALVLREIHPGYAILLGVWQVREGMREALKKPGHKFETFESAISFACSSMSVSRHEILRKSTLWHNFKNQTRITDFA